MVVHSESKAILETEEKVDNVAKTLSQNVREAKKYQETQIPSESRVSVKEAIASSTRPTKDNVVGKDKDNKGGLRAYLTSLSSRNKAEKEYLATLKEANEAKKKLLEKKERKAAEATSTADVKRDTAQTLLVGPIALGTPPIEFRDDSVGAREEIREAPEEASAEEVLAGEIQTGEISAKEKKSEEVPAVQDIPTEKEHESFKKAPVDGKDMEYLEARVSNQTVTEAVALSDDRLFIVENGALGHDDMMWNCCGAW